MKRQNFINQRRSGKMIFRDAVLIALLILLLPVHGLSRSLPESLNVLQDVFSQTPKDALLLRFEFQQPVDFFKDPVFHKQSVHVDIPNASIHPSSRVFFTGDSLVPQVLMSKPNPHTLRLRFLVGEKMLRIREDFEFMNEGNFFTLRIGKSNADVLDRLLARAGESLGAVEDIVESQEWGNPAPLLSASVQRSDNSGGRIQSAAYSGKPKKKLSESDGAPAKLVAAKNELLPVADTGFGQPFEIMSSGKKMVTMLSVVLGLIFVIFYFFKKFVLKNTPFGNNEKLVRVLNTGYLGPKKNIVLVEVAGEVMVLGISNDHISLLGNIQNKERIELIRDAKNKTAKGTLWSRQKNIKTKKEPPPHSKSAEEFPKFLKQYTQSKTSRIQSVEDVMAQIRRNLGKLKTV